MKIRWLSAALILSCIGVLPFSAQGGCPVLVNTALQAIGGNCDNLGRNTLCYGNDQVSASFFQPIADEVFARPADQTDIANVRTVAATSLSVERTTWGVAVMNVQANVPDSLPGQGVTFVLLGDSELENAVAPDAVPTPRLQIYVTTNVNAILRSGPGLNFNSIGRADAVTVLIADAVSADKQWVRVATTDTVAWTFRQNLVNDPVIDSLDGPDETTRGPMQAFYLRTGIGSPECLNAPQESLLVQGPRNFEVSLTVNGAQVTLGSTVMFRTIGTDGNQLEISVLDGKAEVLPNIEGAQPTVIREGNRSVFCLSEAADRGTDGEANDKVVDCNGTPPQRIPTNDVNNTLCTFQDFPTNLLHYAVNLQCPGDPIPTPVPVKTSTPSAPAIKPTDANPFANCAISVVGPYGTVSPTDQVFQWLEVAGVDSYVIKFFDPNSTYISEINSGLVAGVNINPARSLVNYPSFQYAVFAYKGGQEVCRSSFIGVSIEREGSFDASYSCSYPQISISWSGGDDGSNVTLEIPDMGYSTGVGSGVSGSASTTMSISCPQGLQGYIRTSAGDSYDMRRLNCGC